MSEKTFSVIEYSSFYAIRHNATGKEQSLGDGVDALTIYNDNDEPESIHAGDPRLIPLWEKCLNDDEEEMLALYFPELVDE